MKYVRFTHVLYGLSLLVGFAVYLRGFMAMKSPVEGYATWDYIEMEPKCTSSDQFPGTFQRLVIILIDALRADFVLPLDDTDLPQMDFVKNLIVQNKTVSFLAKAHPPTVTLPRIKALTTGDIPGFVDVVMNFDSTALREDNIISQFKRNGRTLVFYGDDTWIRLFPDLFLRKEGTTSFFVTDYTQVDQNVTRHLDNELAADDWDVLILHYLGLDHIGHLAGPYSPLVQPKLKEMDDVVEKVYKSILQQDAASGEKSLLLLCGDHGMSDHGSHGGSSLNEVNTPFVFLSSLWDKGDGKSFNVEDPVSQVDLVPTVALLLGVPIPQNSLGNVIPSALYGYSLKQQLSAHYINARQLMTVFRENVANWDKDSAFISLNQTIAAHENFLSGSDHGASGLGRNIQARYIRALRDLRERIAASLTKYDMHAMGIGLVTLWVTLSSLVLRCIYRTNPNYSSMYIGLIAFIIVAVFIGVHIFLCTSTYASPSLCNRGLLHVIAGVMVISCGTVWCFCINVSFTGCKRLWDLPSYSMVCWFVLLATVIHSLTLMASSFVEEEHQTWYLLVSTLPIFLGFHLIKVHLNHKNGGSSAPEEKMTRAKQYSCQEYEDTNINECYLQVRDINHFHSEAFSRSRTKQDVAEVRKTDLSENLLGSHILSGFLSLGALLMTIRIARSWNRTGDKWAHLPDVGDWLVCPDNRMALSTLCICSLCGICAIRWKRGITMFSSNLLLAGATAVYLFRAANGALSFPWLYGTNIEKGVTEARITYFIIFGIVFNAHTTYRNTLSGSQSMGRRTVFFVHLQTAWTLMMLLLYKPHNIPLVLLITIMEVCLRHVIIQCKDGLPAWAFTLVYVWMGNATFFLQGNSNSISSVDVSAGYIGLADYKPVIIGLLLCLSTFAGHIFWMISLMRIISEILENQKSKHLWEHTLEDVTRTVLLTRALPLAMYTFLTTVQRYHLFVWTVFSPKLLYEGMLTVVMVALVLLLELARQMR